MWLQNCPFVLYEWSLIVWKPMDVDQQKSDGSSTSKLRQMDTELFGSNKLSAKTYQSDKRLRDKILFIYLAFRISFQSDC